MNFSAEFLLQIIIALGSGFGAYAAIRSDLSRLHEIASNAARTSEGAHRRIDDLLGHPNPR